jgi:16S rRNA G966 N2-methylase RsmD
MREFVRNNHVVYIISPIEKRMGKPTKLLNYESYQLLRLQVGNIQKTNTIEKGISTLTIEKKFVHAITKYFGNIKFDLIFLDPPYKERIIDDILSYINNNNLLSDNGLIICEYEFMEIKNDDFIVFKEQIYGSKKIRIFKKKNI